jgi:hypothetical protein
VRDDLATIAASINARLATLGAAQKGADAAIAAAERTSTYALIAACVALAGVLITAFVTWRNGYLQARVSQQLKHADFRQTWINALREEMARFQLLTAQSRTDADKFANLAQSMSMILLRMDRNDEDYDRLVGKMDEVMDLIEAGRAGSAAAPSITAASDLLLICQDILKREWDVTKDEMNRTPLIWPFDRKATATLEAKRKGRVAAVAKRRDGKPAAVPRHLDKAMAAAPGSLTGRIALAIKVLAGRADRAGNGTDATS